MTFLVPTLKRRKKNIPSFGWKYNPILVGNNASYKLGMGCDYQWVHLPWVESIL